MKKLISFLIFVSNIAFASTTFDCKLAYSNLDTRKFNVHVSSEQRNLLLDSIEEYKLYISSFGSDEFELQALDLMNSSRTYSAAKVQTGEKLELIVWKREALMELSCERVN